jgi:hypothetical protein
LGKKSFVFLRGALDLRTLFFLQIGALGLAVFAPIPVDATQSALAGHHSCEFTDYAWPISPEAAAQVGGHGSLEYDADARGTITDGWMTIHTADDTHALGQNRCDFELVSGKYEMKSAISGTTTIKWKLRAGSDAHCGAYIRDSENLGFVQSARDFSPITYTSNFFLDPDGRSNFESASAAGIEIGACDATK